MSTWFRDYLYIPLGGNHVNLWRWRFNILLTFLISGLWHGANWTFVVWGALHGFYYLFSKATQVARQRMMCVVGFGQNSVVCYFFQILSTFVLVCFAWIFFRANNLVDAGYIISHLISGWEKTLHFGTQGPGALGLTVGEFIFALGLIFFLLVVNVIEQKEDIRGVVAKSPALIHWAVYAALVLVIMNLGIAVPIPFIYFQF